MRAHGEGTVVLDERIRCWNYLWWENGKRRSKQIGPLSKYPSKRAAWKAAKPLRDTVENHTATKPATVTVSTLVEQYRIEKMPQRYSTRRAYEAWLRNYIVPHWGDCPLSDLQPRPVELWLQSLKLSPRSKGSIRGLLHLLLDYAMWRGELSIERNPMELVSIKDVTKRTRQPRSLTIKEFGKFIQYLKDEPFRTIALLSVCFGLRISECLALRWSDVDWLNAKLSIRRAVVDQRVDAVKTIYSERAMAIDADVLELLKRWKQTTQFSDSEDWLFASPIQLGRLPWSSDEVNRRYHKAASAAEIGNVTSHAMRHTYRSWLDAVGTPLAVQQKLMRHADIRTTMSYGDVVTDQMEQAATKVAALALNGL